VQTALRWPTYLVLAAGVALRISLAVVTPADRAYDDHYQPVRIILREGRLPSAADCWECYQPPLYYVISAGCCALTQNLAPLFEEGAREAPSDNAPLERGSGSFPSAPEAGRDQRDATTKAASAAATKLTPVAGMGQPSEAAVVAERVGRRTLQFVSVVAGCVTLWVCLLVLRSFDRAASHEALALAFVAFLPQHIYMSAMATNEALTYLLATLAVYAALRAHAAGWPARGCLVTGLLTGATVLCKGYGWITVAAIALALWLFTRRPTNSGEGRLRREVSRPLALSLVAALALAIWPAARNVWIYGKPHLDNFDLPPETPMRFQPPGSSGATSFFSFRFGELLRHPWLHMAHVDSFWTEFYGRLWFDYEGFKTTLAPYPPWGRLWERCAQAYPEWNRSRWEMLLNYAPDEVPPDFGRVAVVSYIVGLPLTVCVLGGLIRAVWTLAVFPVARARAKKPGPGSTAGTGTVRSRGQESGCCREHEAARAKLPTGREFGLTLLATHFVFALLVPVVQTLRLPHFAAMKAGFALSGLASVPVLVALVLDSVRGQTIRSVLAGVLWALVVTLALADGAFVVLQGRLG
jgi:hypothetical protein